MNKTLLLNLNNNAMNQLQSQINELESYIDKHELKKESVSNSTVAWQIEHSLLTLNMIINAVKKSNPNEYKWSLNMNRILVHFHGALGTEVGLEDLLETFSCIDVDSEGLGATKQVGFSI